MENINPKYKSDNCCININYRSVSDVITFIILFPYLTFKKPYFKANTFGIYYRTPKGFGYGKEIFIDWNKIDAVIGYDKVFTIHRNHNVIQENELNIESISNLDFFEGYTQEEYEDNIGWIENGLYVLTKKTYYISPQIHEFGNFFNNKSNEKNMEMIKVLWLNNLKSNERKRI